MENYEYIHKPKHYGLFSVEDLQDLVSQNRGIDVCALAEKTGLDKDAYRFNILKYALRREKPGEPTYRDVMKIREYCDIWLRRHFETEDQQDADDGVQG